MTNENGDILDGHHRYKICTELGIKPEFKTMHFENELLEKKFVIEINLLRRQMTDYQRLEVATLLEPIEAELARQRQLAAGDQTPLGSDDHKGKARDIAAQKAGLSGTTYQRGKFVMQYGPEEVKENLRNGDVSINYAYRQAMRELEAKKRKEKPSLVEPSYGDFDVILADPPWQYDINHLRGSPNDHYAVMTNEEIKQLGVPAAKDAILFLWTTAPKLDTAIAIIDAWGFVYKTHAIWVKHRIGTGYYFRGKHELLLVAVKGDGIGVPAESNRPESVFEAKRGIHSQKPELVYEMIERMYPGRHYLELFARGKPRNGWKTWGFEAEK